METSVSSETPTPLKLKILSPDKRYKISSELDEKNNSISLSCALNSKLETFFYEKNLTLDDFIKINKYFKVFEDIKEIGDFISETLRENKVDVISDSDSENLEGVKLVFKIFDLKGNEESVEILLEKKEKERNEINSEIIDKINELIIENDYLKKKLKEREEELMEREDKLKIICSKVLCGYNSLIIKNRREQDFLDERLNGVSHFHGKSLVKKLLFRSRNDGDRADTFHKICDHKSDLLFLIQSNENYRFGGFI